MSQHFEANRWQVHNCLSHYFLKTLRKVWGHLKWGHDVFESHSVPPFSEALFNDSILVVVFPLSGIIVIIFYYNLFHHFSSTSTDQTSLGSMDFVLLKVEELKLQRWFFPINDTNEDAKNFSLWLKTRISPWHII